jgi:hypothetical protein
VSELLRGRRAWLEAHPIVADGFSAAVLTVAFIVTTALGARTGATGHHPDAVSLTLGSVAVMSLTLRRRLPVAVLLFVAAVSIAAASAGHDVSAAPALAYLIAMYTVAAHRGLARSLPAGVEGMSWFVLLMV